jgi:hypothetical protein
MPDYQIHEVLFDDAQAASGANDAVEKIKTRATQIVSSQVTTRTFRAKNRSYELTSGSIVPMNLDDRVLLLVQENPGTGIYVVQGLVNLTDGTRREPRSPWVAYLMTGTILAIMTIFFAWLALITIPIMVFSAMKYARLRRVMRKLAQLDDDARTRAIAQFNANPSLDAGAIAGAPA